MFKKLFHKHAPETNPAAQSNMSNNKLKAADLDPRVVVHYGIPSTASTLAFDSIQRLLAVATLDGRIKIIGGDNIECLLVSPKQLPFKYLEFLQNQGFLVSVSNENDIQVWDLKLRDVASTLHWECNITSFSVMFGTQYMYIGDEQGAVSVMKYDMLEGKVVQLPYRLPPDFVSEKAEIELPDHHSVVGLLSQPGSFGNRLVIAYDNGALVLWNILEAKVVFVRGNKDLHLMDELVVNITSYTKPDNTDDASNQEQMEKEISSLCWASSNGSVLAVGYVDGDIMLWNFSTSASSKDHRSVKSSNEVVKLQLASSNRRLPVIVLHWSADVSINDHGGLLFVYGGDEIGSAEVLSILRLDWSSGLDSLKCLERVDLTLHGSFADMRLLPKAGAIERSNCILSILTNPGQLHIYGDIFSSDAKSEQENEAPTLAVPVRTVVPTTEPHMTIGQLHSVCADVKLMASLSEVVSTAKVRAIPTPVIGSTKWPLTGGLPSPLSANDYQTTRVYVGGYYDGSVRIWDATYSSLLLIYALQPKLEDIQIEGLTAPVSALDFCSSSLSLVIGNEEGLVRLYTLVDIADDNMVHLVSEDKHEAIGSQQRAVPKCKALFSLLKSSLRTLKFLKNGARVAVGYECGRVALLNTSTFSVLLLTDVVSIPTSPVISICSMGIGKCRSLDDAKSDSSNDGEVEKIILLTKDAKVVVLDSASGNIDNTWSVNPDGESTAVSMDFVGTAKLSQFSSSLISKPEHQNPDHEHNQPDDRNSIKAAPSEKQMDSSTVLFSCDSALVLCSLDSLFQKATHYIQKVNLVNPCCWTMVFKTNAGNHGLALLYQTGVIEIRSFPELEIVQECSLMSLLRWNFRKNMERTMTSTISGLLALGNGCEFSIVSLLASENDFRIPESLPCLHDHVIAAAADAAIKFSLDVKKKQDDIPGIFGGFIKGIKAGKLEHNANVMDGSESYILQFDSIFSRAPGSPPPATFTPPPATVINEEVLELNIDDIELDEPVIVPSSSSSQGSKKDGKGKEADRDKLFEGASNPAPKVRTVEEIAAKYRKPEAAAAAAARARERLVERQEKLENLSRRTEELQNGAENFASMAQELAKRMDNRSKWWKL